MSRETVKFYAANSPAADIQPPIPSSTHLPPYLRSIPAPTRSQPTFNDNGYETNVRACAPFLDAATAGWTQYSWSDIHIEVNGAAIRYHFSDSQMPILSHRQMRAEMAQAYTGYLPVEFMWLSQWQPQTPAGYSLLITHPLNRPDLPFLTTSGIIDADVFTVEGNGQVPFYLRAGFSGLIPAGTPLYQLIPIRRTEWDRELLAHDAKRRPRTMRRLRRYFTGGYRREFWQRKQYR
jgi:hypothetical protein